MRYIDYIVLLLTVIACAGMCYYYETNADLFAGEYHDNETGCVLPCVDALGSYMHGGNRTH